MSMNSQRFQPGRHPSQDQTDPSYRPTVRVRVTRRGFIYDRTYDAGAELDCKVDDLALVEDHGDHYHGGSGWMHLVNPEELLPLLPADEAALWQRRRAATVSGDTAEHQAAHKALRELREAKNPPSPFRVKPQTMDTPNEQWAAKR